MARCRTCGRDLSANDINLRAMEAVGEFERKHGRTPRDVSRKSGLGYDVESSDAEGVTRLIEVKGFGHEGLDFALRWSQHRAATTHPDKYWFYFVNNCHSDTPQIECVRWKNAIAFGLIHVTSLPSPPQRRLGRSKIG